MGALRVREGKYGINIGVLFKNILTPLYSAKI
jgi:hypothetical protein